MAVKKNIGAEIALYPTPLVLCGTYDAEGKANLATLAWVGVCCGKPPAVQVSLQRPRHTFSSIMEKGEFTVNIPSSSLVVEADYCGMASGRNQDKFDVSGLTSRRGEFVDAPIVEECPICMECKVIHTLEIGTHVMFVGEILASWVNEDCLAPDGIPDPSLVSPLLFTPLRRNYHAIGDLVGGAFNIGKKLLGR
ncbi:MAG: flavin reductase family protein [Synergistaceae bacterium]|jgi:flavin reductase (DIM6/NTAB) family NADH-FMN oxidoreductase RutF|nr:flavin reductase family protein [Synergistaceae bacterium]